MFLSPTQVFFILRTGFSLDPEAKAIVSASSSPRETRRAKASEIFPVCE